MPDTMLQQTTSTQLNTTRRVLVVGGRASADRLLDLARWAGAAQDTLHVLVPGEYEATTGDDAVARLRASEPGGAWPLQSARLLDGLAATGAGAVVLGYPADADGRADFALAVQRIRAETDAEVIVYFERHNRPWQRILVPYLSSALDGAALRLASQSGLDVTLLHTVEPFDTEGVSIIRQSYSDDSRCTLRVVETRDPTCATMPEEAF